MPTDRSSIARVVRVHAETIRLLGVDFVPVGTRGKEAPAGVPSIDRQMSGPAESPVEGPAEGPVGRSVTPRSDSEEPGPRMELPSIEVKPKAIGESLLAFTISSGGEPAWEPRERVERERRLAAIRHRYESDAPHKHFHTVHTNIVFGEGDPCARLMFVGEAPGEEEDRTGRPFVGRAGQLLDKMIAAMGLGRQDVYIANVLKTRPPNNATPTLEESRLCAPYLYEQIGVVAPEVIVTLGLPATRTILGTTETMGRLRGRWATFSPPSGDREFAVMPTYHPAYLLRNYTPQERAKVWSDLRLVMDRLGLGRTSDPAGLG
ncbi:MAG: uracil-DNA glycosylase [Phycisphaeraceae bacterium]|nr:uracil-DNA glycosylase [Phycisphaeraceae bacterium]HRJ48912.1 uracil-DNA glycosylase [Phycisphaerales bacterium]